MKHITGIVLAIVLALIFIGVVLAAPVLFANQYFETGLDHWLVYGDVSWLSSSYVLMTGTAYTALDYEGFADVPGVYTATFHTVDNGGGSSIQCAIWDSGHAFGIHGSSLGSDCVVSAFLITPSFTLEIQALDVGLSGVVTGVDVESYSSPATPTPPTVSATIPLTSGNQFIVNFTWTFGEMAIAALLLILIVSYNARWLYDVILQLWSMRGDNDGS